MPHVPLPSSERGGEAMPIVLIVGVTLDDQLIRGSLLPRCLRRVGDERPSV